MEKAWSTLEELGAVGQDGRLTALGRHMVRDLVVFQATMSNYFVVRTPG